MPKAAPYRWELAKVFLWSLLSLFLIPAIALVFVSIALPDFDRKYTEALQQGIDRDGSLSAADKQAARQFVRTHPPSTVFEDSSPDVVRYRDVVCPRFSPLWQFCLVRWVSLATIAAGLLVLLAVLGLAALAFTSRGAQYISLVLGWRLLTWTSAAEAVIQGSLVVWLSFWVTAYCFERYYLKLILLAGLLAACAVIYTVKSIFKRPPSDNRVDGELVAEADAPGLWAHVRDLAARLETAPPENIIAGIDTNFFVTEAPLSALGRPVKGRSLYVSIPLLRLLDASEAEAVLAHELGHLRGKDSASSAALGPKLVQFDHYCQMMYDNGATYFVFCLMRLYRVIFEFALQSDSRQREFQADRIAAHAVTPSAIVTALIKIAAYASYRALVERKLFEHNRLYEGGLGIAGFITSGLSPYAASSEFVERLHAANVPHPFDSHPPLLERMKNVGHEVDEQDFGPLVTAATEQNWADEILTAPDIEARLWQAYEDRFVVMHEESLAYRYEPADDEEREVVLKFFPDREFALKTGTRIQVTYAGIDLPGRDKTLPWDAVKSMQYEDGYGADNLEITHPDKSWCGAKTTKVTLHGIGANRAILKEILNRYWQRHQVMRAEAAERAAKQQADENNV